MKHFEQFKFTGLSFEERVGSPSELDAALGCITVHFQELEATLAKAIASCLSTDDITAHIVTAELSFSGQAKLLAALTRHQIGAPSTPEATERLAQLEELVGLCLNVESLRNQYMHSFWLPTTHDGRSALRRKRTAKNSGYREQLERVDSGRLLDISDHLQYLCMMVEQFFDLTLGAAEDEP